MTSICRLRAIKPNRRPGKGLGDEAGKDLFLDFGNGSICVERLGRLGDSIWRRYDGRDNGLRPKEYDAPGEYTPCVMITGQAERKTVCLDSPIIVE